MSNEKEELTVLEKEFNDAARERKILFDEALEARDKFANDITDGLGKEILEQLNKKPEEPVEKKPEKKRGKFITRLLTLMRNGYAHNQ